MKLSIFKRYRRIAYSIIIVLSLLFIFSLFEGVSFFEVLSSATKIFYKKEYLINLIREFSYLILTASASFIIIKSGYYNFASEGSFYLSSFLSAMIVLFVRNVFIALILIFTLNLLISSLPVFFSYKFASKDRKLCLIGSLLMNYVVFYLVNYLFMTVMPHSENALKSPNFSFGMGFLPVFLISIAIYFLELYIFKRYDIDFKMKTLREDFMLLELMDIDKERIISFITILAGVLSSLSGSFYILSGYSSYCILNFAMYGFDGFMAAVISDFNIKRLGIYTFIIAYIRLLSLKIGGDYGVFYSLTYIFEGILLIIVILEGRN